jgi:hypothetical protein
MLLPGREYPLISMLLPGLELSHLLVARDGWMLLARVEGVETRFCTGEKSMSVASWRMLPVFIDLIALPLGTRSPSDLLPVGEEGMPADMEAKVVCTAAFLNRP